MRGRWLGRRSLPRADVRVGGMESGSGRRLPQEHSSLDGLGLGVVFLVFVLFQTQSL